MDPQDGPTAATPDGVTLAELAELRERGGARLLDLRAASEFERRHIPGSVSIPAAELEGRTHELPPRHRLLLVVAATAAEARRQAERLRERGWLRSVPLLAPADAGEGPWEPGPSRGALWEPTPIVEQWAERLPAGPVCDLGCGSGRNAVYLAQRGHAVTAIDRLPDALALAERLAQRHGAALRTLALDLGHARPPLPAEADPTAGAGYAAVLMIRFLQRELFPWIAGALSVGGLFLLETYLADPPAAEAARAPAAPPARRLRPREAWEAFTADTTAPGAPARWGILEYGEAPDASGEAVARLVARREA
jgi:rhodanese-related sulfurtransferase